MIRMILAFATALLALPAFSQEDKGGIVYGDDWAYFVSAPAGWIMDSASMANQGIYALFYREGTRLQRPNPIIYVNSDQLESDKPEALESYRKADLAKYSRNPSNKVSELATVKVGSGATRVYRITMAQAQFEAIAYLQQGDAVHLVILACFSEADLRENLPRLEEVLRSMNFMDKS